MRPPARAAGPMPNRRHPAACRPWRRRRAPGRGRRHPASLALRRGSRVAATARRCKAGEYEFAAGRARRSGSPIFCQRQAVRHRFTLPEGLTSAEIVALLRRRRRSTALSAPPPPRAACCPTPISTCSATTAERADRPHAARDDAGARRRRGRSGAPDLPLAEPAGRAGPRLDRREGDGARRRAGAHRRRLYRAAAPRHAAPGRPDRGLCADAWRRQPLDRPLDQSRSRAASPYNTYLEQRPAADADRQSGARLAARRRAAGPTTRRSLFRRRRHGGHSFANTLAEHNRNVAQYRKSALVEPDPLGDAAR